MRKPEAEQTINELVRHHSSAAATLEHWGIHKDGLEHMTLADACTQHGLDPRAILVSIWTEDRNESVGQQPVDSDLYSLLNHVSKLDHRYLWGVLPTLQSLAEKARESL